MLEASGWKGAPAPRSSAIRPSGISCGAPSLALAADGKARIDRLFLNGRAIAATVTLTSGDTAWCWKIAYDEGLARFSPGVQLSATHRKLLASPTGARRFLRRADHPMIDHVWRERLMLSDRLIAVRQPALPFALACHAETLAPHRGRQDDPRPPAPLRPLIGNPRALPPRRCTAYPLARNSR